MKIFYMAYEKVMGRPHPALRQRRLKQLADNTKRSASDRLLKCCYFVTGGGGNGYEYMSQPDERPQSKKNPRSRVRAAGCEGGGWQR